MPGRREHLGVAGPAEREQRETLPAVDERLHDPWPTARGGPHPERVRTRRRGCSRSRPPSRACRLRHRWRPPSPRRGGPALATSPTWISASPSSASAATSRSASPPSRARSTATSARRSRSAGSSEARPRTISSQPRSGPASLRSRCARASHPFATASLPCTERCSRASQIAMIPARTGSEVLKRTNARSRCSIAPSGSPSHHSARPRPSWAPALSASASAASNAGTGVLPVAGQECLFSAWNDIVGGVDRHVSDDVMGQRAAAGLFFGRSFLGAGEQRSAAPRDESERP